MTPSPPQLSIEFGHSMLGCDGAFSRADAMRSADLAAALTEAADQALCQTTTSVLVDDKQVLPADRERLAEPLIDALRSRLRVDFVCYESDLVAYVENLVDLVEPEKSREKLRRSLSGRIEKYGSLPCSADIAIWHLLRLGMIEDRFGALRRCDAGTAFSPCDIAISVLQDNLAEYETAARSNILHFIESLRDNERVIPIYYPVAIYQNIDMNNGKLVSEALKEVHGAIRARN
jgi:hypothetical protein